MNRLQHSVGITDAALSWLHSYITELYQRVTTVDWLCKRRCSDSKVLLSPDTQHWTNPVKHHWWCVQNPGTRACYCTPRLRECAAIRPSADNAAAFATCAKLRCPARKYDRITPVLQHLHWLPICVRPTYKVLLFAYSVMHDQAPCYLAELLSRRQPNRRLTSASLPLLTLTISQTVTHGDRRFAVAAATLWNGLPDSVRDGKDTATV